MPSAVKISDSLANKAKTRSKIEKRSFAGQIEYWATIGEIVEENPDMPYTFIKDILIGREQANNGELSEYIFGEGE